VCTKRRLIHNSTETAAKQWDIRLQFLHFSAKARRHCPRFSFGAFQRIPQSPRFNSAVILKRRKGVFAGCEELPAQGIHSRAGRGWFADSQDSSRIGCTMFFGSQKGPRNRRGVIPGAQKCSREWRRKIAAGRMKWLRRNYRTGAF